MKSRATVFILLFSLNLFSQEFINFSINTDTSKIKGFEITPVFDNWYINYFVADNDSRLDWGGGVGYFFSKNSIDFFAGAKIGISKINGISAPIYGLEADLLHNTSDYFFVGIKFNYNKINYKYNNIDFLNEFNVTLKIGIKI